MIKNIRLNKKFKAFTILEVLVALVVSSIVFGIASLSYTILFSNFVRQADKDKQIETIQRVREYINYDVFHAGKVLSTTDGMHLEFNNGRKAVDYRFAPEFIIRETMQVNDTFKLMAFDRKQNFQQKAVVEPGALLDELLFTGDLFGEKIQFHFKKIYGADVMIE